MPLLELKHQVLQLGAGAEEDYKISRPQGVALQRGEQGRSPKDRDDSGDAGESELAESMADRRRPGRE